VPSPGCGFARAALGMDEAITRGARFLALGADALFVEAPVRVSHSSHMIRISVRAICAPAQVCMPTPKIE
jgi:2-methylisocitrate lyase-like PEP mutase family enzyme